MRVETVVTRVRSKPFHYPECFVCVFMKWNSGEVIDLKGRVNPLDTGSAMTLSGRRCKA
jgi:hypothetical protein